MKFGIIGNEQMVQNCIQLLKETPGAEISFLLYDISKVNAKNPINVFCEKNNINCKSITKLNSPENYEFIKNNQPDYLLSINNFFIIKEDILALPKRGTINFHNSVPSKYHGINIPSWVIFNGEDTHGSMWHFVEKTIDTGDVISFGEFPVTKNETAASLTVKCIKKGIELFPELIKQLLENKIIPIPQSKNSSYYGKKDLPATRGYIDFNQTSKEIDRLVRGLNYLPYSNPYLYAKIKFNDKELVVNAVESEELYEIAVPGKIVLIDDETVHVMCKDAIIKIIDAMDESFEGYEGKEIADFLGIKINDFL
jgi:methionyl-tRNA formyltransferase